MLWLPMHARVIRVAVANNVSFLIITPFFAIRICYRNVTYLLQIDNNRKTPLRNMQIMETTLLQQFNPFSIYENYIILKTDHYLKGDYTDEDALETYEGSCPV